MVIKRMTALYILLITLWCTPYMACADFVHRVLPGETAGKVAKQYGITIDTLLGNNQYIKNPNNIFPNQVLIIPDSYKEAYIVQAGDTLFIIAGKFRVTTDFLTDINSISDPNTLYVGQSLMVPKIYYVRPGDTLFNISSRLGVKIADIATINNLQNVNNLYIGQPLVIWPRSNEEESLADVERELSKVAGKHPGTFFYKGRTGRRQVALTFDDGPGKTITPQVLDVLGAYGVRATFFLLGINMAGNESIVKRAVAEGHVIANHTWHHSNLRKLTEGGLQDEIMTMENEIKRITGVRTALMRPPYGFATDNNIHQLQGMGYRVIKWSVDSKDWRDHSVDQVLINTMPSVRDGSIILMHDYLSHFVTREALPEIISSLLWQGYTFVTVDELLGINAYK